MVLDPEISCDVSFNDADPTVINHLSAHGGAGVADDFWADGTYIGLAKGDKLVKYLCGSWVVLDLQIPAQLLEEVDYVNGIAASDAEIAVLPESNAKGMNRDVVVRKRDQSWRVVPGSENAAYVRAFGHFVSLADGWRRTRPDEESAGSAEWRKKASRSGGDVSYKFRNSSMIQPGRLHIFDVENGSSYTIETKQGDSEVLLIDNKTIYYRVSDRLYSAPITNTGLGTPKLIAKDEVIRDAHWAFSTR